MSGTDSNPSKPCPGRDSPAIAARKRRNEMKDIRGEDEEGSGYEDDARTLVQDASQDIERGVTTKQEWIPFWLSKHEEEYEPMLNWDAAADAINKAQKEADCRVSDAEFANMNAEEGDDDDYAKKVEPQREPLRAHGQWKPMAGEDWFFDWDEGRFVQRRVESADREKQDVAEYDEGEEVRKDV